MEGDQEELNPKAGGKGEVDHARRECKARSVLNKFKEMEQKVINGEEEGKDKLFKLASFHRQKGPIKSVSPSQNVSFLKEPFNQCMAAVQPHNQSFDLVSKCPS